MSTEQEDQIWGGSTRDLQKKLSDHYDVDQIWIRGDYYHEERDEMLYDVLTFFDGDEQHFIAEDVPVFGHFESGAAGVNIDDLPPKEDVQSVVQASGGGDAR